MEPTLPVTCVCYMVKSVGVENNGNQDKSCKSAKLGTQVLMGCKTNVEGAHVIR